jgi:hypothetical protein
MIKQILACLVGSAMGVASAFALPTVSFTDGPGNTGGGEFYAATSANGSFTTFCLEYNEHISFGTTYYYEVSQAAKYNGGNTMDPLSKATAWLYLQFLNGTLAGYTHTQGAANELQQAFWFLEGETGGVDNDFAKLAATTAGTEDNNGFYGVGVMNLWANADGTGARQDQLIRVPDGGSTLTLLGMGIGFLALVSRRIRTSS